MDRDQASQLLKRRWHDFKSRFSLHLLDETSSRLLTDFKKAEHERQRIFKDGEMSQAEVVGQMRALWEMRHRSMIQGGFNDYPVCAYTQAYGSKSGPPQIFCEDQNARFCRGQDIQHRQGYSHYFFELTNKSVPLYIINRPHRSPGDLVDDGTCRVKASLLKSLGSYLYDR